MKAVTRKAFEALAEAALARLPEDIRRLLYNVQIEVRDAPGPEAGKWNKSKTLLGLYKGLTRGQMKNTASISGSYLPARIVLYQKNIESFSADEKALARQVEETLRHEIAHHFGFDEAGVRRAMASKSSARSKPRPRRR